MMAVLSPSPSPTSSHRTQSPPTLPPLVTNHPSTARSNLQRPPSYAKNRMSTYSTTSNTPQSQSRPLSHAFPSFHSSLPYALVRDFAYPIINPYHYGPPAESANESGNSTPASDFQRRLSDPSSTTWEGATQWSAGPWGGDGFFTSQLPPMAYGDGPPYSEDDDLHSPVVVSSRHKKAKSSYANFGSQGRSSAGNAGNDGDNSNHASNDSGRGYVAGTKRDGSRPYDSNSSKDNANRAGKESEPHSPNLARDSLLAPNTYSTQGQRDSHFATTLPNRSYMPEETRDDVGADSDDDSSDLPYHSRDSRYSKDYQFTIASPDEEMHGKAVALFDFERENENELPLKEGQVILVSYRHGQGWLVAEDPKTRESGLVPEEYVRLLRDIEGGWSSLSGELAGESGDEPSARSPVSPESESGNITSSAVDLNATSQAAISAPNGRNSLEDKRPPVVSTFSTSSKDLSPYPHRLLGTQPGQTPPQVIHYGSQPNPTSLTSSAGDARSQVKVSTNEGGDDRERTVKRKDSVRSRRDKP